MKVCLVSHSAEGLVASSAGGSESQIGQLARALAARGHDVALVSLGLEGPERIVEGVRLRAAWDPCRGRRIVRAFTYRYPHLVRQLLAEDADVYYTRGAGFYLPFVVEAARLRRSTSILGLASDRDLYRSSAPVLFAVADSPLSPLVAEAAHLVYRRWALRRATWIAVQNTAQAASCRDLGLPYAEVPNIIAMPPRERAEREPARDVVWAGNVLEGRRSKGLAELAALARRLPDVGFSVAGTLSGASHRAVIEELHDLPNVALLGSLGHDDLLAVIADHRLVVNTSPSEGFSNVMLEGWSLGRPAVTLSVDPSGLLSGDGLGVCARGDLGGMAAAVAALLRDAEARARMAARARAYVEETHNPARVCEVFEALAGYRPGG